MMKFNKRKARQQLARLEKLTHQWALCNLQIKAQLRAYSKENGYKVLLRRESFEAMLRAVPPEPGSDAGASSVRPVRS